MIPFHRSSIETKLMVKSFLCILHEGHDSDICGFCGRSGSSCTSTLKKSSHKSDKSFVKVTSDCEFFFAYKRVPDETTKTHKCNKVISCPAVHCNTFVWKYNMLNHIEKKHPDLDVPDNLLVSDYEKKAVMKHFGLK